MPQYHAGHETACDSWAARPLRAVAPLKRDLLHKVESTLRTGIGSLESLQLGFALRQPGFALRQLGLTLGEPGTASSCTGTVSSRTGTVSSRKGFDSGRPGACQDALGLGLEVGDEIWQQEVGIV